MPDCQSCLCIERHLEVVERAPKAPTGFKRSSAYQWRKNSISASRFSSGNLQRFEWAESPVKGSESFLSHPFKQKACSSPCTPPLDIRYFRVQTPLSLRTRTPRSFHSNSGCSLLKNSRTSLKFSALVLLEGSRLAIYGVLYRSSKPIYFVVTNLPLPPLESE